MKIRIPDLICLFLLVFTSNSFSRQQQSIILNDIIKNIDSYRNKTVTMTLRLKNLDTVFDKIIFYDRKNFDIVFDISELKKQKAFKKQVLNLHPGLEYNVIFKVKGLIEENIVTGELESFNPVILSKLPN